MQFTADILRRCWFLAGPTACGKTATSLLLAERLRGEIISLDSMAIYRGMDIGTAKPDRAEQIRVPHHLIDIIQPDAEFSVADYVSAAESVSRDILSRDHTPLFVGGTGLYLRSVLRGVFQGPPADWELRKRLEQQEADRPGSLYLHLQQVDHSTAEKLHARDIRRVIRALEVWELTGKPLSAQQAQGPLPEEQRPPNVFWLSPPRAWLYARIDRRAEEMIGAGLVDEVQQLLALIPPLGKTARQALGYKEIIQYLAGECSLSHAIETLQTRTRQFAKRQHTWYRGLEECREIKVHAEESPEAWVERIMQQAALSS